jgi:hypothetical protein
VARTLADLESVDAICRRHLAEALAYRGFDSGKIRDESPGRRWIQSRYRHLDEAVA